MMLTMMMMMMMLMLMTMTNDLEEFLEKSVILYSAAS